MDARHRWQQHQGCSIDLVPGGSELIDQFAHAGIERRRALRADVARIHVRTARRMYPVVFAKNPNLHRQHMNASQRRLTVVACSVWQPTGVVAWAAPGAALATKQLAAEADTSERTIRQAKVVATQATPAAVEAVKAGEMSLNAAVEATRPTVAMVLDGWNRYGCLVRLGVAVK
jgi:hypothetical protein